MVPSSGGFTLTQTARKLGDLQENAKIENY